MKYLKKLGSVLLALVMVLALTAPAFAATYATPPITVEGHAFEVYQLFKGEPQTDETTGKPLASEAFKTVEWGDDLTEAKGQLLIEKLTTAPTETAPNEYYNADFATAKTAIDTAIAGEDPARNPGVGADGFVYTAMDLAKMMDKATGSNTNDTVAKAIAKAVGSIVRDTQAYRTLNPGTGKAYETGYYLLYDKDAAEDQQAETLLRHVKSDTVKSKSRKVPDLEKTVLKEVVDEATGKKQWVHVTDYNIGDMVEFKITATLPDGYENMNAYELVFYDVQHEGFVGIDDMKITIVPKANRVPELNPIPTVTTDDWSKVDGWPTTVTDEVKAELGLGTDEAPTFTVTIPNMKFGSSKFKDLMAGDQVVLSYKAELKGVALKDDEGEPILDEKGNPVYGKDPDGFTNKVWMDYLDRNGDLPEDEVTVFTFELDVNKVDGAGKALAGAGFTLYKLDGKEADGTTDKWEKVKEIGAVDAKPAQGDTPADPGRITFEFDGLKAGRYMLRETKVPTGYNGIDDIYLTITPVYENQDAKDGELKSWSIVQTDANGTPLKVSVEGVEKDLVTEGSMTDKTVDQTVVNNQGVVLPETGGIGTTIFYIVGGVLVVGAVVLLITKRRASADEE